jgi:ribosomal protein S18 acetylase RimI-like enzyme
MHPLDNIIWQALTTRQAAFAEVFEEARRFPREVTSLAAFPEPSPRAYESLAGLAGPRGTTAVFLDEPYETQPGWEFVAGAPLLEMVCDEPAAGGLGAAGVVKLGQLDAPEMVELAALTKPGPFGLRTHQLGNYFGIRLDGKLVAMAGERLQVPGYTEVSAVCTHPDHLGKGYAGVLMAEVMRGIQERGEIPCLHVRQDNARAIGLYERMGFKTRKVLHFAVLRNVRGS